MLHHLRKSKIYYILFLFGLVFIFRCYASILHAPCVQVWAFPVAGEVQGGVCRCHRGRAEPTRENILCHQCSAAKTTAVPLSIQHAQLPSPKCYRTLKSNNNKNNNNPMMSLLINFLKLLLTLWNHRSIAWSIMYEMKSFCPLCDEKSRERFTVTALCYFW